MVMIIAIALTFYDVVAPDDFSYMSVGFVFIALLLPRFGLDVKAIADLLVRVQSDASLPEKMRLLMA